MLLVACAVACASPSATFTSSARGLAANSPNPRSSRRSSGVSAAASSTADAASCSRVRPSSSKVCCASRRSTRGPWVARSCARAAARSRISRSKSASSVARSSALLRRAVFTSAPVPRCTTNARTSAVRSSPTQAGLASVPSPRPYPGKLHSANWAWTTDWDAMTSARRCNRWSGSRRVPIRRGSRSRDSTTCGPTAASNTSSMPLSGPPMSATVGNMLSLPTDAAGGARSIGIVRGQVTLACSTSQVPRLGYAITQRTQTTARAPKNRAA